MGLVKFSRGTNMKEMNLIAAGGAALNIVGGFLRDSKRDIEESTCVINPCFIDTSKSNLRRAGISLDDERAFIIDGVDGSGKKRDTNYKVVSDYAKEILHQYKPNDINVIVHSASGGSGSVIGPILGHELINRDCPVMLIVVGGSDSRIEIENTIKTLKGYEVISRRSNKPINVIYFENSVTSPREKVDSLAQSTIALLSVIFSGLNDDLDSADLINFLNYHNVTNNEPQLTLVDFFYSDFKVPKGQSVISAVTLTDREHQSTLPVIVDYQAVGFLNESTAKHVSTQLPINMVNIVGYFPTVIDRLEKRLAEIDEMRSSIITRKVEVDDNLGNDRGIIL